MPEENEKVEDFISLWKNKLSTENLPSRKREIKSRKE